VTSKKPDIEALKAKAESGDVAAQEKLGHFYYNGIYVETDYGEAEKWWSMAYQQGSLSSTYNCAVVKEHYHGGSYDEVKRAFDLYTEAAEKGLALSQLRLGDIYENGLYYQPFSYDPFYESGLIIEMNLSKALYWYGKAGKQGNCEALYRHGSMVREGRGTIKNIRNAFKTLLKAACQGHAKSMKEISNMYHKGVGTKQNIKESYIWALLAKANDPDLISMDYETSLENQLESSEIMEAQDEAGKRYGLLSITSLDENEFLDDGFKPLNEPSKREQAPTQVEKNSSPKEDNTRNAENCDPDPSPGVTYKYVRNVKKNFDPSLVEFELVAPRKLRKTEDMDFTHLKITYNHRDSDKKSIAEFSKHKITRVHRRLLICLAAQNSINDPEKRAVAIKRILCEQAAKDTVSRLNSLFNLIFPDCVKTKADKMLNRQTGLVNIRLKIDTTKIINARDYGSCWL